MMGDSDILPPDLLLVFGPRSLISLTGIVTLVLGVWHVDRTWDEKGSKAYHRVAKGRNSKEGDIKIPSKDLDDAFPFPWAFFSTTCHAIKGMASGICYPLLLLTFFFK